MSADEQPEAADLIRHAKNLIDHSYALIASEGDAPIPSTARAVRQLLGVLESLPMVLDSISSELEARNRKGDIAMDDGTHPSKTVFEVATWLAFARSEVESAVRHLRRVEGQVFHMTGK